LRGRLAIGALTKDDADRTWGSMDRKFERVPAEGSLPLLLEEVERLGREAGPNAPLDPLMARSLGISVQTELGVGAIATSLRQGRVQKVDSNQRDPELRLLMESVRDSLKYESSPDYILIPKGRKNSVEVRRWRADFGLEALEYDASPDHWEVLEVVEHLATFVNPGAAAIPSQ